MPGNYPNIIANIPVRKSVRPVPGALARLILKSTTALGGLVLSCRSALAGVEDFVPAIRNLLLQAQQSNNILMLAVFGGAMSFALMSASWLIRERHRISNENLNLKATLADLRARNDRNEALINIPDQRMVVWNGSDEKPVILGSLPTGSGAPEKRSAFLGFGTWLDAESASTFESALKNLRISATSFDLALQTRQGGILAAHGQTSGSHAFVRFNEIGGERQAYVKLQVEHAQLLTTFTTIQSLFEKLPMPVWVRRNDGSLFWVNQAYASAVESTNPEAAVAENIELFDTEQRREINAQQETSGYFTGIRPAVIAGNRRSMDIHAIRTESGMAGIACDKSDVEATRSALAETVESHSRMLDQLGTAIAIFDKKQRLTFHNAGFTQLWKLDPAFLESGPTNGELFDAIRDNKLLPEHPDWRKWREAQLEIYTAIESVEDWWHLPDGQTIRVVASPKNQGGSSWVFENVTKRLELESSYNSLMRVQGETLDHLSEAVAVFGSDGKLKLLNPALVKLWQFPGLKITEGVHIAKILEAWRDTVSSRSELEDILGAVTGFDDERADLDGRLVLLDDTTLEFTLVPLPDGQSMLTMIDVTASVNFEKALHERAEALEESDLLKTRFIQHVSYELRAPLTSISGFSELLATPEIGSMNPKQAEYLDHITVSAGVLRAVVDDMLDLASFDAGILMPDFEQTNLPEILDEILATYEPVMKNQNIRAKIDIAKECKIMIADRGRLSQILQNLISNAVNFSPDGGKILIEARQEDTVNVISVSDEGPGVAEELRETIFERFEGRPAGGQRQGTGLGLSIVKSFMQLHGGSVHIEAAGERGARFVCRFPLSPTLKMIDYKQSQDTQAAA